MAKDDLYLEFINKLKKENKKEEAGKMLSDLLKFGSAAVYVSILNTLTEKDKKDIEKIKDDKEAQEEIEKRFTQKTGKTPKEFVDGLRDQVAKGYLFPELIHQKKK